MEQWFDKLDSGWESGSETCSKEKLVEEKFAEEDQKEELTL